MRLFTFLALTAIALATDPGRAADHGELTPLQSQGKQLYYRTCIHCHAPGVWGTNRLARRMDKDRAVLEKRTDLSPVAIRAAVRVGLGSMPPFRRTEVSDADVEAIAAYLTRPVR